MIKVLVIDDSAMVREVLRRGLNMASDIQVIDVARDPYDARDKIVKHRPDVLTLDVEMPRMDGVEFLRKLMPQYPLPVVMVSSLTEHGRQITMDALEAGAVEIVCKPKTDISRGLESMMHELHQKVRAASRANVAHWRSRSRASDMTTIRARSALTESTDRVVAIGASTGGTEAIRSVVSRLPRTCPGLVIVQHMPPGFTKTFAERLDSLSEMEVREAEDGDRVMPGRVLLAPGGDRHMKVLRSGGQYRIRLEDGAKVCGHQPSVEVLMQSVAKYVGSNAVGVMLTGMGHDGADGMKAMRDAGARTIAQDEASCVVFGMPKVAHERGGAEALVPLDRIAEKVIGMLEYQNA